MGGRGGGAGLEDGDPEQPLSLPLTPPHAQHICRCHPTLDGARGVGGEGEEVGDEGGGGGVVMQGCHSRPHLPLTAHHRPHSHHHLLPRLLLLGGGLGVCVGEGAGEEGPHASGQQQVPVLCGAPRNARDGEGNLPRCAVDVGLRGVGVIGDGGFEVVEHPPHAASIEHELLRALIIHARAAISVDVERDRRVRVHPHHRPSSHDLHNRGERLHVAHRGHHVNSLVLRGKLEQRCCKHLYRSGLDHLLTHCWVV
mmetsp:Transcript_41500/g.84837  ORF Transcript_41500/g.84837 Transcript_41500/m.84837 type:complete len:254 (+) Transcript_41500:674-1435(+)